MTQKIDIDAIANYLERRGWEKVAKVNAPGGYFGSLQLVGNVLVEKAKNKISNLGNGGAAFWWSQKSYDELMDRMLNGENDSPF